MGLKPAVQPILLTPKEAAKALRMSVANLLRLDVPYVAIGEGRKRPRRRYRPETLASWAAQREVAA
jgi:hypothetical protein